MTLKKNGYRFLQIHALIPHGPMCMNRDDIGRQKSLETIHGDFARLSSQAIKFSWRNSDVFHQFFGDRRSIRTKNLGFNVFDELKAEGASVEEAYAFTEKVAELFGPIKGGSKKDKFNRDNLRHVAIVVYSAAEVRAICRKSVELFKAGDTPSKEVLLEGTLESSAVDIALWGRGLANKCGMKVDGASSVANFHTVTPVAMEADYFTAVDDLNEDYSLNGAAHVDNLTFSHGVFYGCVAVDRLKLFLNLGEDVGLMRKAEEALIRSIATTGPEAKSGQFNSFSRAQYLMAELSYIQPMNYSGLFIQRPVQRTNDVLGEAVRRLRLHAEQNDHCYDLDGMQRVRKDMYVEEMNTRLSEVLDFVVGDE